MFNEVIKLMVAEVARSEELLKRWMAKPYADVLATYTVAFPDGSSCCGAVAHGGGAYGYHMAASQPDYTFDFDNAQHIAMRWAREHTEYDGDLPVPMLVPDYLKAHIEIMRKHIQVSQEMMGV